MFLLIVETLTYSWYICCGLKLQIIMFSLRCFNKMFEVTGKLNLKTVKLLGDFQITCVGYLVGSCPIGRQSLIKNIIKNPTVAVTAATIQASITFNHFGLTYLKIKFKNRMSIFQFPPKRFQ